MPSYGVSVLCRHSFIHWTIAANLTRAIETCYWGVVYEEIIFDGQLAEVIIRLVYRFA